MSVIDVLFQDNKSIRAYVDGLTEEQKEANLRLWREWEKNVNAARPEIRKRTPSIEEAERRLNERKRRLQ